MWLMIRLRGKGPVSQVPHRAASYQSSTPDTLMRCVHDHSEPVSGVGLSPVARGRASTASCSRRSASWLLAWRSCRLCSVVAEVEEVGQLLAGSQTAELVV
jgi:hypothetical protein